MKRIYIILLTLLTVLAFSLPVFAFETPDMGKTLDLTLKTLDTSDPEVARIIAMDNFDTMRIKTDTGELDGNFASLEWITKSTYAEPNTQTKYQTSALWFKIGDHVGWVRGENYRTQAKPGETIYERATISKEAFINAFMFNSSLTREEAEAIINTEEYLYTGAWISIYNDYNLNGKLDSNELKAELPMFLLEEDIDKVANKHFGGSAAVKSDWKSRFQKIKLNAKSAPDFFSTPEGETEWQEHFLTNAKTYKGETGEVITVPITLHNVGSEAITDFACTWYGAGWDNPYWKEEDIELKKDETKDFEINVTVPDFGKETRLVFRANVDGKTPANETNQDNNITVITIQPDGLDISAKFEPTRPYWEIPIDVGHTYVTVHLNGMLNLEHNGYFMTDGFFEASNGEKREFNALFEPNQQVIEEPFTFKVTAPGRYRVKGCIPALDELGNPKIFEIDGKEYIDIDPTNNCDEIEVEVRMGGRKLDPPPVVDIPKYEGGDHIRPVITG